MQAVNVIKCSANKRLSEQTWAALYPTSLTPSWTWIRCCRPLHVCEFFMDCLQLSLEDAACWHHLNYSNINVKKNNWWSSKPHVHTKRKQIWLTSWDCLRQQRNKLLVIVQCFHSINHIGFAFSCCGSASAQSKRISFLFCVKNKIRTGSLQASAEVHDHQATPNARYKEQNDAQARRGEGKQLGSRWLVRTAAQGRLHFSVWCACSQRMPWL